MLVCLLVRLFLFYCSLAKDLKKADSLISASGTFQTTRPTENASFPMKNMNTQPSGQSTEAIDVIN